MILVTGGCGFIGSNFVLEWSRNSSESIVNLDAMTYAGNLQNLASLRDDDRHIFIKGDIGDMELVRSLLSRYQPRAIIHFAAESHVDRSIHGPEVFVRTNIQGTFTLLESARIFYSQLDPSQKAVFRFIHVSTDEVYGSLEPEAAPFTESTPFAPNSPYAASKAASDHLARAWYHTYGLPVIITNCSNNYGPYQFPEKLIPLMISNALRGLPLPVYGDGLNVRDWLYVVDHCKAISRVIEAGAPGRTYNIGGWNEKKNIEIVEIICSVLDEMHPDPAGSYRRLISFVRDRPGHDRRYAIDATRIAEELHWRPQETFETGIRKTIAWYLANESWVSAVQTGEYQSWIEKNYC
ncbi:MAG: dTDP-glucose 4,6-dehydratase [Nevskiaceae bacterium]|nr:MAG: dTDP-glucose 4,6-dehydratase [Nevskiaceae bacterium]